MRDATSVVRTFAAYFICVFAGKMPDVWREDFMAVSDCGAFKRAYFCFRCFTITQLPNYYSITLDSGVFAPFIDEYY